MVTMPSSFVMESRAPKLLDRVRQAIRMRHYSRRTEEAYVHWIKRCIVFHQKVHPATLVAADVSTFLGWLVEQQRVSASTQNQALCAILFLYRAVLAVDLADIPPIMRARTPERLPVVLSRDEVAVLLRHLCGTMHLVVTLLYGAGLRLEQCLERRVKDFDFDRDQITVRQGKGEKIGSPFCRWPPKTRCGRIWWRSAVFTTPIGRTVSVASRSFTPLPERVRAPRETGCGSLCFPRGASVGIRGMVRLRGTTCMNRLCRKPWRRPPARRG
jgi:integrase